MNIRFKWLLLIFLFAAPAFAQNVRVDNVAFSSVQGFPFLPGATITICTAAGAGLPCTPAIAGTCLSISDTTCNQSPTITADAFGNYGFWIQPGSYTYTVTKAGFGGFGPKALTVPCQPASTCTMTGPQTMPSLTVSGAGTLATVNNTPSTCSQAGANMGLRIAAAYASNPYSGIIDATCETGAQTWSTDVLNGIITPTKLLIGKNIGIISVSTIQHILTNNLKIEGPATNDNIGGVPQAPQSTGLRFRYTGSSTAAGVINIGNSTTPVLGTDLSYVHIDCNSLAASAVVSDRMQVSTWYGDVSGENCTGTTFVFLTDGTPANGDNLNNNIYMLGSFNAPSCVNFQGNSGGTANVAASLVHFLRCSFASAATSATIANAPTGATESGGTVTITATATCTFTTGQRVLIAGVGVAGYNGSFLVLSPGCNGGSTFTYTNPITGLGTSGGGTATFSTNAIDLYNADSVTLLHAYVFRASGTGCSVYYHFNSVNNWNSRGTLINYLDPNQGGVCSDPGSTSANKIGYLFLENWLGTSGSNTCTSPIAANILNIVCGGGLVEWADNNGWHSNVANSGFGTFGVQVQTLATSVANQNSPNQLGVCGNFWTGSASNQACAARSIAFAPGANPLGQVNYDLLAYTGSGNAITYPGTPVHAFHGNINPSSAAGSDIGSAGAPWGNLWLGTAATNNFKFQPAATAAARIVVMPDPGTNVNLAFNLTATSAAFATATTAGTCVQNTTAVAGAATTMAVLVSPVSTPGVGAVWSAFVSSAGNVTINECAVATSAGGTIAFNIRVTP